MMMISSTTISDADADADDVTFMMMTIQFLFRLKYK
jgi:hypothetical protein